jgi:membrane-bound metal-dependent hydrolase YbcI (DUF457 family)
VPTPVGHTLAGIAIALNVERPPFWKTTSLFAVVLLAANLPDFDFIPGYLMGDAARFHWGPSHSIAATILAGLAAGLVCWKWRGPFLRPALIISAAWASHILLDLLLGPVKGAPFGLELFWPFSHRRVMLPWSVFLLYPGDQIHENPFSALLHPRVWPLVARELMVLGPFVLAAWLIKIARVRRIIPSSQRHTGAGQPGREAGV